MLLLNLILTAFIVITSEAYEADRLTSLPDLNGELEFGVFSGYLDATPGTHLHYIFVESENDPANDPVLLWLNGGPGASSLLGLFTENGPFRVNGSSITMNPYAWNKVANIIFLESPAGVGYSYSDDQRYNHDDDKTSENNLLAIKSWFDKFPQYKDNDFYLTGESYAGVYIPTLSVLLLDEPSINYKGFAIGNGYLDQNLLANSHIRYAYHHGLIDTAMWSKIISSCCKSGDESPYNCDFVNNTSTRCAEAVSKADEFINQSKINQYSIYESCIISANSSNINNISSDIDLLAIVNSLRQNSSSVKLDFKITIPCVDNTILINYLGRDDVRKALNIPTSAPEWIDLSTIISLSYINQYKTLKSQVTQSIKAGKRGLIYNGDTDMACDFLGDEWFSDSLGFQQIGEYKAWYVDRQVAGFVKNYEGFAFVTIRGSGHYVPETRPKVALYMITKFLSNGKLA